MGRPKAWLPIAGEPMLARVVRTLGVIVSPVVVVAADGQDLPALPESVIVVRDARPDRGPLEGIAAGLDALDSEVAYLAACDTPLLLPSFVEFVVKSLGEFEAAVPRVGGRPHPLAAALRVDPARREIRRQLATHILAIRNVFDRLNTRWLDANDLRAADSALVSLCNANTPEEMADLDAIISSASRSNRECP
jgi:molybdenum cofactor guanylyltransferase